MLDVGRGPLLVGVADRSAAVVHCAELPPEQRLFDLVEARVDLFAEQNLDGCAQACAQLEASGTPVIVTIRTTAQGGRAALSDDDRLGRFLGALAIASWADIESDATIVADIAALVGARPDGQLIVSHHDFARTPPLATLLGIVDTCRRAPGAIAKIATAIATDADRDTLFQLLAQRPGRTTVIGMGASDDLRIELSARGSLLAYGYLETPTAPGQLSAAETHARLVVASPAYAARRAAAVSERSSR
jgi:3-dehydroquinate dehydratase I